MSIISVRNPPIRTADCKIGQASPTHRIRHAYATSNGASKEGKLENWGDWKPGRRALLKKCVKNQTHTNHKKSKQDLLDFELT